MADEIVTPDDVAHNAKTTECKNTELLYQNTPLLTELLKVSYEDYAKEAGFRTQLIIIGLRDMVKQFIVPICQQSTQHSKRYLEHLEQFNHYNQGDFIQYPDALKTIAVAMTHLLQCAIESYRVLNYPQGYNRFLDLFESIFNNPTIIEHNHHRNVMLMMAQLRQKP